jgi:phosphoribosylanthranilate isomerase
MTRGLIKICGVTTADDAALAAELGVDLIGVNLYPQSPRYALPQNVPSILEAIGDKAEIVAVLVEPTRESLLDPAVHAAALQTIQWHGAGHEPRPG